MRVAILTSSRADYSIYYPLLKKLKKDRYFKMTIIAFGTHLSETHGLTIKNIKEDGFRPLKKVHTMPDGDSPASISKSIGNTIIKFSGIWEKFAGKVDLIICLGDRYEMFAAVSASIPFNINVAHIHGGEITTGAIDNIYRNCLTHVSKYHFTSTPNHTRRVAELKGNDENIYYVGSMGLESLTETKLLSAGEFETRFSIPIDNPVLVTFHPETVEYGKNEEFVKELVKVLHKIEGQIIITMPNADTLGNIIRQHLLEFSKGKPNVFVVESLGMQGYYSCLNLCRFVLGNSSSGIIEAASFGKYVINIGNRQKGRDAGKNVIHCAIDSGKILEAIQALGALPPLDNNNIYWGGNVSLKIVNQLKQIGLKNEELGR